MRSACALFGLLVFAAVAMAACQPDPPATGTTGAGGSQTSAAGSVVNQAPTLTARPTPAAVVQPTEAVVAPSTPAATGRAQLSPVDDTRTPPPSSPTPQPQPTPAPPRVPEPAPVLLRLQDDLDDPLGYCIDVRGFGAGIRLDADLQAHSCKSGAPDDQSFAIAGAPGHGGILLVEYDLCLAVADPGPGAPVLLRPCDDPSVSRAFELLADGRLRLLSEPHVAPAELCVGVADGSGQPAGGRNHLRRDLLLLDCGAADPALITWHATPTQ